MDGAIGIGKSEKLLIADQSTVLKRYELPAINLSSELKKDFKKGDRLKIFSYKLVGNHWKIETAQPEYLGAWYVFIDHVHLEDPNGKVISQ